jgi:DNA-binding response OmpR family regulator
MPTPRKSTPDAKPSEAKTVPEAVSKPAPVPGQKRILIVEDERPLAHALELKFRHEGFDTKIALDGEEALREAIDGKYDVILLDLIMPRMDGFAFMEEMKNRGVKTPIVILTELQHFSTL